MSRPRPSKTDSGRVRCSRSDAELPLSTWTDEALFEEVRRGSEPHFNAIYERYFRRIYAFVYLRARNHADAEELTQETFTVVFQSAEGWGGRASPLAWIYGVAKNTVSNHLRRLRTSRERLEQAGPTLLLTTSPTWSFTPEEQLDLDRAAHEMQHRLSDLADWQAQAFVMRHAQNLSIPEISKRTGRSSDAVRSGLYRVKKLLMEVGEVDLAHGRSL